MVQFSILYIFISHDVLTIYDGNQTIAEETGGIAKSVIRSSQSNMKITFHSDHMGTRKGFYMKISFFLSGKYDLRLCYTILKKFKNL